jgi:integrase
MPAKIPSLYRSRHGVYYLRLVLPLAQRSEAPKACKEVWRSLRTKDSQTAKRIALRFAYEKHCADPMKIKNILEDLTNPLLRITTPSGAVIEYEGTPSAEIDFAKAFMGEPSAPARRVMSEQERQELINTEALFQQKEAEARLHREHLLATPKKPASPLFSKYVDTYLTFIKNSKLKERTKKAYAAKLLVVQGYFGKSATLADVTPERILDFQTWLAKDDPITDRKAITPRTIDEYSNVISNVYKKVIKRQAENPIEGRLVSKKQRMKSPRKPFTPDELTRIFNPARLNQTRNPADFFVPILGLLTGSRPASICQLRVGDIRREDGLTIISYHDYLEENSSKTSATNRIIPVHPLLEKVGFYRYIADIKALPDTNATTLLFPWLNQYEQGFADVPTQNFRTVLQTLKIYIYNVKVFYSLRHTTNQRMKERGVPEDFRSQYIGHENDSVNAVVYGGTTPPKFLLENTIPHLMFEEIDWDNIQYPDCTATIKKLMVYATDRDKKKMAKKADE